MIKEKVAENTELLNRFTLEYIYHILGFGASGEGLKDVIPVNYSQKSFESSFGPQIQHQTSTFLILVLLY